MKLMGMGLACSVPQWQCVDSHRPAGRVRLGAPLGEEDIQVVSCSKGVARAAGPLLYEKLTLAIHALHAVA